MASLSNLIEERETRAPEEIEVAALPVAASIHAPYKSENRGSNAASLM